MSVINTRKLRKIGNSRVVTVPEEVIKELKISDGQKISFNIDNGKVIIEAVDNGGQGTDILSIAERVSNQYNQALKELVDR
ncbi:AbrB/MazE/SpoVT family DNA-binding domain-containing protein [Mammaliicoccus sciuri]|uniref:AbrB/MazE/SpoVT family DNA-binding domain-containing protein n=1 Tax=Mammaliicoccus sciuri TaxID=1296 RepID=UPI003796FDDE